MRIKYSLIPVTSLLIAFNSFSQNVGVGTITPEEKLHVEGNIKVDTIKPNRLKLSHNAAFGKILTSDADGNASWQATDAGSGNIGYGVWGDCATNAIISGFQPVTDTSLVPGNRLFGGAVSISGNFAAIGQRLELPGGSVSIFQFNGTQWVFMQKITDPTGSLGDKFGESVSIDGDNMIVGSPTDNVGANTDQGSACIFHFDGTSWVFQQKLTFSAGAAGDQFGMSVSISGIYAVIGAPYDDFFVSDQGSATVFMFDGTNWVQMINLSDAALGVPGDTYGNSVSISGELLIVGIPNATVAGNAQRGSADIYKLTPGNWTLVQKLTDIDGAAYDHFGSSVSIAGDYAVVGAPFDGVSTSLYRGSATIFRNSNGTWTRINKLQDSGLSTNDSFGISVCISGDFIIIGAYGDTIGFNSWQGSAYIYRRTGISWKKVISFHDPGGSESEYFGWSVAIDHGTKRFLVGVPQFSSNMGEAIFGKVN